MSVTVHDYFMGRDKAYSDECTLEIQRNAVEIVSRANRLLAAAAVDGVIPGVDQQTKTAIASGWRPNGVNARTQNAATGSKHITAQAVDIQDTPDRALARWCLRNLDALDEAGVWMENPQWTGGNDPWVHWQLVPPKSGKRVYIPSTNPPIAEALPEQMAA